MRLEDLSTEKILEILPKRIRRTYDHEGYSWVKKGQHRYEYECTSFFLAFDDGIYGINVVGYRAVGAVRDMSLYQQKGTIREKLINLTYTLDDIGIIKIRDYGLER